MLPLCDRDHYSLSLSSSRDKNAYVTSEWETRTRRIQLHISPSKNAVPHQPAKSLAKRTGARMRSHCSESLFTWTTFQGCCAHLLRRNAHSSSRFTKQRLYRSFAAAFMHPKRFSRLSTPSREIMMSGRIPFTATSRYVRIYVRLMQ